MPSVCIFPLPHLMPHGTNILIITDIEKNVTWHLAQFLMCVASFNHNLHTYMHSLWAQIIGW